MWNTLNMAMGRRKHKFSDNDEQHTDNIDDHTTKLITLMSI